ncbi:winged helix-turn-helix domain-containing protein [Photobacterium sp. R1]
MEQAHCKFLIGQRFIFSPNHNSLVDNTQSEDTIHLGINESRALHRMLTEPGTIISRQEMHDYIWRDQGFEVDDSSLTQAISTLRRYLQDSTRSPAFIKTIPKRGYQMIASVDRIDDRPVESGEIQQNDPEPEAILNSHIILAATTAPADKQIADTDAVQVNPVISTAATMPENKISGHKQHRYRLTLVTALLLCVVLPLWAYFSPPPTSSAFYPAFSYQGIPVLIPSETVMTDAWYPLIRQCIAAHIQTHGKASTPARVIVTGGRHNQLWINLIYGTADYRNNMTLTIVTLDKEREQPCRVQ